ncbi:MAG: hypothetical protein JNM20_19090 [Rhizobiales bacterium]|nr:hypothetical protein [Hyphomicrobiales bacterium]
MTWSPLLFPTSRDKELRSLLIANLREEMSPLLKALSFVVFRPRKDATKGFPTHYYRKLADRIDVIRLQWMKYGQPAFIIDFNVIDNTSRYTSMAEEGSATWFIAPRYRAQANKGRYSERWFHIGYLPRLLDPRRAARKEVENACARIREIDKFAKTGQLSPYLRDLRPDKEANAKNSGV